RIIEWGRSICDVLTHMHGQLPPLVHRDVKPDNVMLLDDQRSIKMIDFGTARDLGRTQKDRLAAKTRVYTEGYAPPEQIVGTPEIACPKCQTPNRVREPYCSKCAEPLTDPTPPCNHCGKANRMGSRCCIHCGNRIR